jgi:hypothetical protein
MHQCMTQVLLSIAVCNLHQIVLMLAFVGNLLVFGALLSQ